MADNQNYWTCACGKIHLVERGKAITCQDEGHMVWKSPRWFNYDVNDELRGNKIEFKPKQAAQGSLF